MSLEHELLQRCAVRHGFGTRTASPPAGLFRPHQVHGAQVVQVAERDATSTPPDADAVVARAGERAIGVATADCVPVLAAALDGSAVAAIHAGWRGLAAGVIEAGIDALRRNAGDRPLHAVIGPHVAVCCYEIDAPVLDALRHRFAAGLDAATRDARPGHWWLDLGRLARDALARAGVSAAGIGGFERTCTVCDAERFHSYRRDGPRAGRLIHWIEARPS